MSDSSMQALWRMLTNLSVSDALLLGFLLLCALGGAVTAIYFGIRAAMDLRKERRIGRPNHAPPSAHRRG